MHIITTVFTLLFATGALVCALHAWKSASRCELHASRLRAAVGRITGLEGSVESLTQQLQKLRGQFYALKQRVNDEPPDDEYGPDADNPVMVARAEAKGPLPDFCANYGQAQIEGPLSKPAQCQCGYCEEMRRRRSEFRAAKIPATVGRAKVTKGE